MERIACLVIGYVFGLIQTGYLVGKFHHDDIRKHGSGNAGSTNALRVYGVKAGLITLLIDVLKCVVAAVIVSGLFGGKNPEAVRLLRMYAGAGVILGHNFPFFLGFKGGKGVASTLGLCIMIDWRVVIAAMIVFIGLVVLTKYVSLASLCAYTTALISMIIFGQMGFYNMPQKYLTEMYIVFGALTVLTFYRHRQNIVRLMNGTESKISLGSHK